MHVQATMHSELNHERVVIESKVAESWIGEYLNKEIKMPISLRFAAAPFENKPHLVIGLRDQGRGIDLLIPVNQCDALLLAPLGMIVQVDGTNRSKQVAIDFDEEAFITFVEHVERMHKELPHHEVWSALAAVFVEV